MDSLKLAKSWDVIIASDTVLEVHSSISFYVDIGRQTCSCHEWQLNGFLVVMLCMVCVVVVEMCMISLILFSCGLF